jgi:DNA-directed RNA polymerase specialized sigma24 family protein
LWDRYHEGLLRIARQRLGERRRRSADEEDVVLSAFKSFCLGAAAGRYPNLDDRQSVWKLLLTITLRKANAELKRQFAQKRGGGCVVGESVFVNETSSAPGLAGIADDQLRPDLAAMMNAQCQQLLDSLEDKTLQRIALGKLEGYTNQELAIELNCSLPTIERKLQKIRRQWGRELENGPGT